MQIIGIICEYNPFHNGHIYHINKIKSLYPDSLIILVLNGYFCQRGDISLLAKQDKTKIALEYGVDIVVELPTIFGTQSADIFAYKAIEILNYFQVQTIIFGSETNNLKPLLEVAQKQLNNKDYEAKVKKYLKEKNNYPTALAKALNIAFDFNNPNDLLAISYLKAILQINPHIKPVSIKRTNSYHDLESDEKIVSASNIRDKYLRQKDISKYLPTSSLHNLKIINNSLLFTLLQYKINTCDNLDIYLDVNEGIEKRLKKYINETSSLEEFILKIKTKRYTYNRLKRMLIHILIDLKKEDIEDLKYIHILGFNQKGQNYLNKIKKDITISLNIIYNSNTYKIEKKALYLYDLITNSEETNFENQNKPIIKN